MAIKPKTITQHCIKSHFFQEVMKLPENVKILDVFFEAGFAIKRLSEPVPATLKAIGVTAIRNSAPSVEVEGKLTGQRASMIKDVAVICKALDLRVNTVRVKRMTVQVGQHIGIFARMQKLLPDGNKTKRVVVLGLVKWDGSETAIAKACSTHKFKCQYTSQVVRTVLCEEA